MKIVPLADTRVEEWDRICDRSEQAWLFHRRAWIGIETRYFVRDNLSFAIAEADGLIAVHPLYLSDSTTGASNELLLHSGIHRHTGLALDAGLDTSSAKAARGAAMRHIMSLGVKLDVDRIQLNAHNLAPENLSVARKEIPFWVEEHGFYSGLNFAPSGMLPAPGMATCSADQIVDLTPDEDELFAALDEACRRAVRKAMSQKLEFEVATDQTAIAEYYSIAERSATRTGESLPSIEYYNNIWSSLADTRCALFFATLAGKRVAGLWLFADKGSTSFLAGASDPDYLPLRVNDFLHWSAILWAKRTGLRYYRFGPIFPEVPLDWPIAQVSRFKGKFGGCSRTIIQGSYFRHPEKYLIAAQAHLSTLCSPDKSGHRSSR